MDTVLCCIGKETSTPYSSVSCAEANQNQLVASRTAICCLILSFKFMLVRLVGYKYEEIGRRLKIAVAEMMNDMRERPNHEDRAKAERSSKTEN